MLKMVLKIVAALFAVGFVILQFFRIDQTNPPALAAEALETAVTVPPDIALIFGRSCNDCHSHKTVYPWYANVQPAAWFLKDHVEHGKEHLNLSKFNSYDRKKKIKKLEEICDEVEAGNMPLASYLWLHRDAVMNESEKKVLCSWTAIEIAKLEAME